MGSSKFYYNPQEAKGLSTINKRIAEQIKRNTFGGQQQDVGIISSLLRWTCSFIFPLVNYQQYEQLRMERHQLQEKYNSEMRKHKEEIFELKLDQLDGYKSDYCLRLKSHIPRSEGSYAAHETICDQYFQ